MKRDPVDVYFDVLATWRRDVAAPIMADLRASMVRPQPNECDEAFAAVILIHPAMRRIAQHETPPATPAQAPFGGR